jgi:uncharacterized glyoxalase superfamily protein PhnB
MTTNTSVNSAPAATIRQLWPLLTVSDLARSIHFYCDSFGFALVEDAQTGGQRFWCRLERDGACLMLQQACAEDGTAAGRGRGVTFYLVCDDADLVYQELLARELPVAVPTLASYGMKQLFVTDPDGYALCFESPCSESSTT